MIFNGLRLRIARLTVLSIIIFSSISFASISGKLNSIISNPKVSKVTFGVQVIHAPTGKIVYSHNAKTPLIPASNMKVITSATALRTLGSDFVFKTEVGMRGQDLCIIGNGDPLFGELETDMLHNRESGWVFEDIINVLKEKGISKVNNLIVDSLFFDDNRTHPDWPVEQLNRYYAPQVSGINYNGNCIDVKVESVGSNTKVSTTPDTKYVTIINKSTSTTKGSNTVWCARVYDTNKITVYGKCKKEAPEIPVTVDRPASYFGYCLAEALIEADISVDGQILETLVRNDSTLKIIKTYETPFTEVLTRCNRDSFNLAAECFVKTVSAMKTKGYVHGEWKHGLSIAEQYIKGLGVADSEFKLVDGSGLSNKNLVTADAITKIFMDMYTSNNQNDWLLYKNSLAIGGVVGSSPVRKHFTEPQYVGKVFAKSGTINGVKALSGLCETDNGVYIFSILTNKVNGYTRSAINEIVESIIDESRQTVN